ncbi:helix-turn-helix protein [Ruminiclostridium sufflavum DSM 19573]|uniref:Helix-turn-helix protein n=1 Tax=Ruminiclostridium sufflavum DSM 19573 TaxID=1121337 RepID=A0A318XPK4_9FIRM|nr:helix-turn-helix transcriptional regulator [Ruminiclostridium sufflavum]PYG90286.1 helix-turn-helix protein [Ruminiclostridium sufflavum DSM 19573]
MPLNKIIQEKRKKIGLTQEQIAEYLGVSTPAVNKWERGATYPDISLLPPLARLLKIDLNTLLCFNEGLSEQEVGRFCKEVIDVIRKNGFDCGFSMGVKKIQEYPNCGFLIHSTALLLDGALIMSGMSAGDKQKYDSKITALYERAAKCEDDRRRNEAVFMLASRYKGRGEYGKAQEMLDLLPERSALDKIKLQADLYIVQNRLDEAAGLLERKLLIEINEIQAILLSLVDIAVKEDKNQAASHIAELSRDAAELFELWDYSSYIAPLQVAIAQENVQDSILLLKSILSAASTLWEIEKSPLYRHISVNGNKGKVGANILPTLLAEIENDPKYGYLHLSAEFKQLLKQYRAKCEKI